jgi:O-antigen/teichoic acid export membrane protein
MIAARHARLFRAVSLIGGADLIGRALLLATVAIATRALVPAQFGDYVVISAVPLVLAGIWDLGVSQVVTREIASGRVALRPAIRQAVLLRVKSAALWILAMVLAFVATGLLSDPLGLAVVAISLTISTHHILLASLRAKLEFRKASLALICGRAVTFFLALATLMLVEERLPFLILGYLCGEAATLLLAAVWVRAHWLASGPDPEERAKQAITLRQSAPLAVNSFLILAYNRLDVVVVAMFVSPSQLGWYGIASRTQDALTLIPAALSTALLPMISSSGSGTRAVREWIGEALLLGLVATVPVLLVVQLGAPQIVKLMFGGGEYMAAVTPMRILAVSMLFMVVAAPFLTALVATSHAPATTMVYGAAFGVAMVLMPFFASRWGATGAAIATLSRDPGAVLLSIGLGVRYGLAPAVPTGLAVHRTRVARILNGLDSTSGG